MEHERRSSTKEILREVLDEGACILMAVTHGRPFQRPRVTDANEEDSVDDQAVLEALLTPVNEMEVFYAKLLLRFAPDDPVAAAWRKSANAATDVALVLLQSRGGSFHWVDDDGSPMERELPSDYQSAQLVLQAAAKDWFGASRQLLLGL